MENQKSDQKDPPKSWLQYVTEQSWEPELLISGLAIYATLQMPGLFWDAYQYFQYNIQSGTGLFDEMLPLLIYGVFTTVSYILLAAFITHFVIRAFWVGFIGLMSVYQDGIKYDDLPYSDYYKQQAREKLGSSERMAVRLDHISSLIFSVAFVVVLIMVAVAILYLVFFLLYNVLKLFLDPGIFETYASVLYYTFMGVTLSYVAAIFLLNLKRFRNNPTAAKWHFNLGWKVNAFFMPLVYKPIQHIQLTFQSNISTKQFMVFYALFFLAFMSILMGVMLTTVDANIFDSRNYFATSSSVRHVETHEYSINLNENDRLQNTAALEKPVISSGMMQIFIPYPKRLDEVLNQFCEPEEVPDSLSSFKRRRLTNEQNITCAGRFFSFAVDDSLELDGELMFIRHPVTGQQGFQSYLNVNDIALGRHTFFVKRQPITKEDSTEKAEGELIRYETEIPFWIESR